MGKQRVPVIMDGQERFDGIADAARALITRWGMPLDKEAVHDVSAVISAAAHGKALTAYGHVWEVVDE